MNKSYCYYYVNSELYLVLSCNYFPDVIGLEFREQLTDQTSISDDGYRHQNHFKRAPRILD